MSVGHYYGEAIPRSFHAAISWAVNAGVLLTLLYIIASLVVGVVFTSLQAIHRGHAWAEAMNSLRRIILDFVIAEVAGTAVVVLFLFVIFFVKDAPALVSDTNQKNNDKVAELTSTIGQLTAKVDQQEHILRAHVEIMKQVESLKAEYATKIVALSAERRSCAMQTGPKDSEIETLRVELKRLREACS